MSKLYTEHFQGPAQTAGECQSSFFLFLFLAWKCISENIGQLFNQKRKINQQTSKELHTHKKRPQVKMGGVVRGAREQPAVPFIQQNTHNISLLYFEKKENRKTGWPHQTIRSSTAAAAAIFYIIFHLNYIFDYHYYYVRGCCCWHPPPFLLLYLMKWAVTLF